MWIARALLIASLPLAGCSGGRGPDKTDPGVRKAFAALAALKPVAPTDGRDANGRLMFSIGKLTGTLPPGWSAIRLVGQTTYRSEDFQETMRVLGYRSDAPLDGAQKKDVLVALAELSRRGESVLGAFGPKIDLSRPVVESTTWGTSARFTATGPLTRLGFHYVAAGANEALMLQLDGNSEADSPAHAAAVIQSIRRLE